jgi:hypothetical protein
LLQVKPLLRSLLQKGRGNPHVPEADRPEAEGALEDLDIFEHINGLYVSQGLLREGLASLTPAEPAQVEAAHCKVIWYAQAMIYGY